MLNRRVNILFDDKTWKDLADLARKQNTSIGNLTRQALKATYFSDKDKLAKQRAEAVDAIIAFREKYGAELAKGEDSTIIVRKMRDERYGRQK